MSKRQLYHVTNEKGEEVSLDKMCRLVRADQTKRKTVERTRRAAGVVKAPGSKDTVAAAEGGGYMAFCDCFLVFYGSTKGGGVSIALCIPECFDRADGVKGLEEISTTELLDPKSSAQLNVLKPRLASDKITFSVESTLEKMAVSGAVLRPINPVLQGGAFEMEIEELRAAMDIGWAEIEAVGADKHVKPSRLSALPYVNDQGVALLMCMGTEGLGPTSAGPVSERRVTCPVEACGQEWAATLMRQHVGKHILYDRKLLQASMPCGFCGGESAQYSSDLSQLTGCAVWLKTQQPRMQCKFLDGDIKYSMTSASKCTKTSPCTNVPKLCAVCAKKPGVVHWKYNMAEPTPPRPPQKNPQSPRRSENGSL
jgi:hypothetical protein